MKNVLKVLWNPSLRKALRRIWMAQSRHAVMKQWPLHHKNLQTQNSLQQQQPLKAPQLPTREMGPNADKRSCNLSLVYLIWEILFKKNVHLVYFNFLSFIFTITVLSIFQKAKREKIHTTKLENYVNVILYQ